MLASDFSVVTIVLIAVAVGLLTAAWFASRIALISIEDGGEGPEARLINNEHKVSEDNSVMSVPEIAAAIADGANAFLYAEYQYEHTNTHSSHDNDQDEASDTLLWGEAHIETL